MRLFLTSYRAGKYDHKLLDFIGDVKRVAVITNAKDYKTPEDRKTQVEENFDYYRSIGLQPTEVDLRPFFRKSGAENLLIGHEFVWLAGGNVFLLRRALAYTGMDKFLIDEVKSGSIILGGESAGAIIAGPTLRYSEMNTDEDSPNYVPKGYDKEIIWEGLGLVDFVPVPHYQADDYAEGIQDYINRLDKAGIPHKDMTNEQAIVINKDNEKFLK